MSAIVRRFEKRYASYSGGTLENPANWLANWLGGQTTASGQRVTERNALYAIDVMTCITKLAQTIAQMPFPVYKRIAGGGKERATDHPLYRVLQEQANSEMTAFTFKETLQAHLDTWGNCYAWIDWNSDGECAGLWPLLPDRTHPYRVNGELFYYSRLKRFPNDPGEEHTFPAREILHIPGFGFDGLVGYSVIEYMRESIGLAMAQEEYGARLFSNGSTPPAVITHEKKLGEEDIKRIKASWKAEHEGSSKAWRIGILEQGMDIKTIGIPPQDAQFLEGQKFSRARISGFYGVPPPLMGDTDRASAWGQGIEALMIGFLQTAIQPRATRWEQHIDMKLLGRSRDKDYFAEFVLDGLLRGDIKVRYDAYALGWGKWLTTDDIRNKESMNAYVAPKDETDIGKTLVWPVTYTTASRLVSGESVRETPAPPPPGQTAPAGSDTPATTAASRRALAAAQRFSFTDTAERIIRREQVDVARALKRGSAALEALYVDHEEYVRRQMLPILRTYGEGIRAEVARELGREIPELIATVESYAAAYSKRHAAASLAEARQLVGASDTEAVIAAWSTRATWISMRETVLAGSALAKAAYRAAGVTALRWNAGDECDACTAIAAVPMPIDDVFIRRGAGGPDQFIPEAGLPYPPLCDGCECVILAANGHASRADDVLAIAAPAPITVNVAPPAVNVTVNPAAAADPPDVHVTVQPANAPEVHVDVAAPAVTVEPPPPAAVNITNVLPQLETPPSDDLEVLGADGQKMLDVKRKKAKK